MQQRSKSPRIGCRLKGLSAVVALLLLLAAGQSAVFAQDQNQSAAGPEVTLNELLRLPGTIIGEGRNTKAVGPHKIASYRIEQVNLPRPVEAEVGGKRVQAVEAFRLTIIGGPFHVRALPPVIWVDDVAVGYGVENEQLTAITVVTFDRSLLREGASIYLSYGDKEDKEDRVELPEKLSLNGRRGGDQ
jgi:hypothetical protein